MPIPKMRFKNEDGSNYPEWEEKKLGEICTLKNGYAFGGKSYSSDGVYNVITIANVQGNKYITITDKTNKMASIPKDIRAHQILKEDDILISLTGNVGRVSLNKGLNNLLNQRVGLLVVNDKNIHNIYAYYSIANTKFLNTMIDKGQGLAQKNIAKDDIENYVVQLPTLSEQKKIADFLSAYDEAIANAKDELAQWKLLKKGLLQQMFI